MTDILAEVQAERQRQDTKWGEQNHPDGTGPGVCWAGFQGPATQVRAAAQRTTDAMAARGLVHWLDILVEELAEAAAEEDPQALRAELVQVAAVAVQWAEAIDRRGRS